MYSVPRAAPGRADVGLTSEANLTEHEVAARVTPTARTALHLLARIWW